VSALAVANGWWFLAGDTPKPTTSVDIVGSVTGADGSEWTLTAYVSEHDGVCVAMTPTNGSGGGAAQGCGSGVRGEPNLPAGTPLHELGVVSTRSASSSAFVFGTAATDVAEIAVLLNNGDAVTATIHAAPSALGVPLRFYAAPIPVGTSPTAVIARGVAGAQLERESLLPK
jgi:hypothetical protein